MPSMCPLYGGCPYLGGSVMGGSTVITFLWEGGVEWLERVV